MVDGGPSLLARGGSNESPSRLQVDQVGFWFGAAPKDFSCNDLTGMLLFQLLERHTALVYEAEGSSRILRLVLNATA